MTKRKYRKVIDSKGNVLNGKRYRDANTGVWYKVSNDGIRTPLDLDRSGRAIKSKYIGGTTEETQNAYWEQAPIVRHVVDSIAKNYNIDSSLLKNRLNGEGFTDTMIKGHNNSILQYNNPTRMFSTYDYLKRKSGYDAGIHSFGLDDVGSYIKDNKVKLINESWGDGDFVNEHGRTTNAASGDTYLDNIGIMAATLNYFKDLAKQRNPKNNNTQNSILANMYYHRGPYTDYKNTNEYDYTKRQTKKFGGRITLSGKY